jgi:TonB family protein
MKRYSSRRPLIAFFFFLFLGFLGATAVGQGPKLDDIAKQLSKQMAKAKIKSVVTTDFTTLDGGVSPEGKILTTRLTDYWASHEEKFSIVERSKLDAFLAEQKFTLKDLDNSEILRKIGAALNVDALVIGTVTPTPQGISLNVLVRGTQDSNLQIWASKSLPKSEFAARIGAQSSEDTALHPVLAGVNGVGAPKCEHCPQPDYSDDLRKKKIEGTVLLSIIVTPEGHPTGIVVIKAPTDVLAQKAVEAVRSWRLKPAMGPDGTAVAARVQVEITFHLYK